MSQPLDASPKKHKVGCLVPLGIYVAVLIVGYWVTRPPLITDDFSEPISRSFSVAIVEDTGSGFRFGRRTLETTLERDPALPSLRYLLPHDEITIDVGDFHYALILEDHGDWQLVEYDYSNTYMATSIYRAYDNRIEPVSYQVTASVGDAMLLMVFTFAALVLYGLAVLINFVRNRRAESATTST